jgi:hypothetical protein
VPLFLFKLPFVFLPLARQLTAFGHNQSGANREKHTEHYK